MATTDGPTLLVTSQSDLSAQAPRYRSYPLFLAFSVIPRFLAPLLASAELISLPSSPIAPGHAFTADFAALATLAVALAWRAAAPWRDAVVAQTPPYQVAALLISTAPSVMEIKAAATGDKAVEEHLVIFFCHLHLGRGAGEVKR
uniref:Uncharacterized protein n=1 Tax=Oryza rufipogon TaxID=4529 RepID=A0A0E0PWM6_ORYRU